MLHYHFLDPVSLEEVHTSKSSSSYQSSSEDTYYSESNCDSPSISSSSDYSSVGNANNFDIPDSFPITESDESLYPGSPQSVISTLSILK